MLPPIEPLRTRNSAAVPQLPVGSLRVDYDCVWTLSDGQNAVGTGQVNIFAGVLDQLAELLHLLMSNQKKLFFCELGEDVRAEKLSEHN